MRYLRIALVSTWLAAASMSVQAGEPVPASSASAAQALPPAPANPLREQVEAQRARNQPRSPFRFVDADEGSVLRQSPPRPSDRAAVLGTERAWIGGRPPLDCAATPRDASCH